MSVRVSAKYMEGASLHVHFGFCSARHAAERTHTRTRDTCTTTSTRNFYTQASTHERKHAPAAWLFRHGTRTFVPSTASTAPTPHRQHDHGRGPALRRPTINHAHPRPLSCHFESTVNEFSRAGRHTEPSGAGCRVAIDGVGPIGPYPMRGERGGIRDHHTPSRCSIGSGGVFDGLQHARDRSRLSPVLGCHPPP